MELHDVIARLFDQQQPLQLRQGVVTATGGSSCSIKVAGATTAITGIKYLASYSPTTNDIVFMLITGKDILILGKVVQSVGITFGLEPLLLLLNVNT